MINSDGRCAQSAGRRRHRHRRGCGQAPRRGHDRARQGRCVGAAARRDGVRAAAEDDTRRFAPSVAGADDHRRQLAEGSGAGLDHAGRASARRCRAQGRSEQQRGVGCLRPRRSKRRAGCDRGTDRDLGGAAHGRHRLHRRRRLRAVIDRDHSVYHVAADQRCAADPHPIAAWPASSRWKSAS